MEASAESQGACTPAPAARTWLPELPSAFEGTLPCPLVTNLRQGETAACPALGEMGETGRSGQ